MAKIGSVTIKEDYDSMDIYSPPSTRVEFMNQNGHEYQRVEASRELSQNVAYTVESIDVYGSYSDLHLEEIPGQVFNTVMFKEVQ